MHMKLIWVKIMLLFYGSVLYATKRPFKVFYAHNANIANKNKFSILIYFQL